MATIDQRGKNWRAQVRRKGYPVQVKTFKTKAAAQRWARLIEAEMDKGAFVSHSEAERVTVAQLLDRYARDVLPSLKGGKRELSRIDILKVGLGSYSLANLTSFAIAQYRDDRMTTISPATGRPLSAQTVKHELGLLQRALKKSVMEWGVNLPRGIPTTSVKMPKVGGARDRRLVADEEYRLLSACESAHNAWLLPSIVLLIETGMRVGELLSLTWENVNLIGMVATLPDTKNGDARTVPLSEKAAGILNGLTRGESPRVIGTTYEGLKQSFDRAIARAEIANLRLHDLRHEATSRFFERGFNPMQVAAITGHKTLQMLKRYTHLKAEDLARMMRNPQYQRPD